MTLDSFTVIVPTCRPENCLLFLRKWDSIFTNHNIKIIIVEDAETCSTIITEELKRMELVYLHLNRQTAREYYPYTPSVSDMIRSAGILASFKNRKFYSQYLVTLDDDVLPMVDIFAEYLKVFKEGTILSPYFSVGSLTSSTEQMRGFPFKDRKKVPVDVQYGGWNGILDYDAVTQFKLGSNTSGTFSQLVVPVPKGVLTTCCIMNTAWHYSVTPIMWQLPLFEGDRYNRFGDIWSGLFIKKTLDTVNRGFVINGKASVGHERASDIFKNLEREAKGYKINEEVWNIVSNVPFEEHELPTYTIDALYYAYTKITDHFVTYMDTVDPLYASYFLLARDTWLHSCSQSDFV